MQQRQLESLVSAATGQPIPGTTPADPSGYGSVHIARVMAQGSWVAWRAGVGPGGASCAVACFGHVAMRRGLRS